VFASQRFDEQYQMLFDKTHGDFWDKNYDREKLLQGKLGVGTPQGMQDQVAFVSANMAALLLKTLEFDAERSAVTHDATRQLLYATGTLNKNGVTREWFQFGVASFFETPQGSPWMTTGAPHVEYLPLWRDLKSGGKLELNAEKKNNPSATLRMVITDSYFRQYAAAQAQAQKAGRKEAKQVTASK